MAGKAGSKKTKTKADLIDQVALDYMRERFGK